MSQTFNTEALLKHIISGQIPHDLDQEFKDEAYNEPLHPDDPNSTYLFQTIIGQAMPFLDPFNDKEMQQTYEEFSSILKTSLDQLDIDFNQDTLKEKLGEIFHQQVKLPSYVQGVFKNHELMQVSQVLRKRSLHPQSQQTEERRVTFHQPRLSISNKPIFHPLDGIESSSKREDLLYEGFQIFCYYLQNILFSIIPVSEHAMRMDTARTGRFTHFEEPLQALRADGSLRNLSQDVIVELRTMTLKMIHQSFRTLAEKLLINWVERNYVSQEFDRIETSLAQTLIINKPENHGLMQEKESLKILGSLIDPVPDETVLKTKDVVDFLDINNLLIEPDKENIDPLQMQRRSLNQRQSTSKAGGDSKLALLNKLRDTKAQLQADIEDLLRD